MQIPEGVLEGEIRESFYVEKMMKSVWAAQLEVLDRVDKVCKKHNIQYFADWGTLLGAIRHKGFIPWDDDMDITMKRKDYEKFCKVAVGELGGEFEVINIHTEPGWTSMLTRIINSRRVCFSSERLQEFHGCPYSVGLDIFPLDYMAPTAQEDNFQCQVIRIVEITAQTIDEMEYGCQEQMGLITQIEKICGVKLDHTEPFGLQLLKLGERLSMMYTEKEAKNLVLMTDHAGNRPDDIFPKECFDKAVYMPFEYTTIPVPVGWETILTKKYGPDYMTPKIVTGGHDYPFYKKQQKIYDRDLKAYEESLNLRNI